MQRIQNVKNHYKPKGIIRQLICDSIQFVAIVFERHVSTLPLAEHFENGIVYFVHGFAVFEKSDDSLFKIHKMVCLYFRRPILFQNLDK